MRMLMKKGCKQWAKQPELMGPSRSHLATLFLQGYKYRPNYVPLIGGSILTTIFLVSRARPSRKIGPPIALMEHQKFHSTPNIFDTDFELFKISTKSQRPANTRDRITLHGDVCGPKIMSPSRATTRPSPQNVSRIFFFLPPKTPLLPQIKTLDEHRDDLISIFIRSPKSRTAEREKLVEVPS